MKKFIGAVVFAVVVSLAQAPVVVPAGGVYSNHIRPSCTDGGVPITPFVCDDGTCDLEGEACGAALVAKEKF